MHTSSSVFYLHQSTWTCVCVLACVCVRAHAHHQLRLRWMCLTGVARRRSRGWGYACVWVGVDWGRGVIRRTSCQSQSSRPIRLIARGATTLASRLATTLQRQIQKSLCGFFPPYFFFSHLLLLNPPQPRQTPTSLIYEETPAGSDEIHTAESSQRLFTTHLPLPAPCFFVVSFFPSSFLCEATRHSCVSLSLQFKHHNCC